MDRKIASKGILKEARWILEHFREVDYQRNQLTREEVRQWLEEAEHLLHTDQA